MAANPSSGSRLRGASRAGSWLALVAATSLGPGLLDCVEAVVAGDSFGDADDDSPLRLVVQSYRADRVDASGLPTGGARPLGSLQRAITSAELERGVPIRLMQVGEATESPTVLLAWVEHGDPDLELNALTASPGDQAMVGWTAGSELMLRRRG